jgi:hypothetical protein
MIICNGMKAKKLHSHDHIRAIENGEIMEGDRM